MTQVLDAQRSLPDCSAIRRRRQATRDSGKFDAHDGVAHPVARQSGLEVLAHARHVAEGVQAIDDGRCTKTSPAGLIRLAALALRGVIRRFSAARRRRATILTLQSLDVHTLRDLGFDRSEIPSAVAELFGEVDVARTRFVQPR
jgi:uncharacterized protein YjiS (DUF1127 family)